MNREKIIRTLEIKKSKVEYRLKKGYDNPKKLLKDFGKFCKIEKEIEVQTAYLQHES